MTKNKATIIAAATPTVLRRKRRQTRRLGLDKIPARSSAAGARKSATILLETNPGIDDGVQDVGNEISEQDECSDDKVQRHQSRIVSLENGLVTEAAEPWISENCFDDDRASDKAGQEPSDTGNQRADGIAKRMLIEDGLLRQTLGERRANVVFAHGLDHACANEARLCGDPSNGKHHRRQGNVPETVQP